MGSVFNGDQDLTIPTFKRRMIELGFSLADFPDEVRVRDSIMCDIFVLLNSITNPNPNPNSNSNPKELIVLDGDGNGTISPQEFLDFFKLGMRA
jgi:hypothetical protein